MSTATLADPTTTSAPEPPPRRLERWYRPALAGLLAITALLYLWGLGESGWANSVYSATAQAGSESWKAFFFGSSDAASSITVDKTPLVLWPMALAVRVFGLSSWSILVPQAIEGVLAVWLLVATVRRTTAASAAGLLPGAALALTPVAVLMFRFNNPDAMLVLLVASAYATLRALEGGARHPVRWLALAEALVGLAFLAKMLQAFLVLPPLALVYLLAARTSVPKRLGHLLVAFGSMVLGLHRLPRRVALGGAALAIVTWLAGPASYAVQTASTVHIGSIPTAGPTVTSGSGPGGMGGPGGRGGFGGASRRDRPGATGQAPPAMAQGQRPTGGPTGGGA